MSQRTTTIALSNDEKERLDDIADDLYGTTSVPYGETMTRLIDEYRNNGMTGESENPHPA